MNVTGKIVGDVRDGDGNVYVVIFFVEPTGRKREVFQAEIVSAEARALATRLVDTHSAPNKLRELRLDRGMSQADLARAVSADAGQLCRWESGAVRPFLKNAVSLARALHVTVADLELAIFGADEPAPPIAPAGGEALGARVKAALGSSRNE